MWNKYIYYKVLSNIHGDPIMDIALFKIGGSEKYRTFWYIKYPGVEKVFSFTEDTAKSTLINEYLKATKGNGDTVRNSLYDFTDVVVESVKELENPSDKYYISISQVDLPIEILEVVLKDLGLHSYTLSQDSSLLTVNLSPGDNIEKYTFVWDIYKESSDIGYKKFKRVFENTTNKYYETGNRREMLFAGIKYLRRRVLQEAPLDPSNKDSISQSLKEVLYNLLPSRNPLTTNSTLLTGYTEEKSRAIEYGQTIYYYTTQSSNGNVHLHIDRWEPRDTNGVRRYVLVETHSDNLHKLEYSKDIEDVLIDNRRDFREYLQDGTDLRAIKSTDLERFIEVVKLRYGISTETESKEKVTEEESTNKPIVDMWNLGGTSKLEEPESGVSEPEKIENTDVFKEPETTNPEPTPYEEEKVENTEEENKTISDEVISEIRDEIIPKEEVREDEEDNKSTETENTEPDVEEPSVEEKPKEEISEESGTTGGTEENTEEEIVEEPEVPKEEDIETPVEEPEDTEEENTTEPEPESKEERYWCALCGTYSDTPHTDLHQQLELKEEETTEEKSEEEPESIEGKHFCPLCGVYSDTPHTTLDHQLSKEEESSETESEEEKYWCNLCGVWSDKPHVDLDHQLSLEEEESDL